MVFRRQTQRRLTSLTGSDAFSLACVVPMVRDCWGGTVVKRGVDVAVAMVMLLLASPVMLLVAVCIWLSSPGPVLFRQVRMGRGLQPFQILKFRTMAHAEAGLPYTLGPDPRITPIGKWLRRSKLDELPQLWNVLCGEMSLIGPRPVIPDLALEFNADYSQLLVVRPGLTDPASLKYSQEARLLTRAADPWDFFKRVVTPDKIQMSLEYIERANLWTDLEILAMTGLICCFPALSRRYGQLPDPSAYRDPPGRESSLRGERMPIPRTESLFVPESAYAASTLEEVPELMTAPWILLQTPGTATKSTAGGAQRSGSRL